ncbi:hypothetical protein [Thalassotalea sp. ND16A]|uniref:hypothetical protein n=1 Tax=Thalassotalea sp. ND16A TaxID=1535422 RepID=UPI00051D6A4E|nr:hypothetical protein [Thalassotalea sp. ND16A]KGJ92227.1 hypothetical protein ND16A_1746 [Thalassotalea sp. ND16A]
MIKALMISILLALSSFTFAIEISELNPVQTLTVKPKNFKEAIEFNITLPQSYQKNTDKEYFIIFDLHPRSQPYLSGLHDWLSHNGEWPWLETIVVTQANYHPELAKLFENTVSNPNNQDILDFFEFDLLNAIDKKYRTNGFRIYSGFMGNGALGLYTLLNRPQLFNAYIIASPTLADDFAAVSSTANTKLAKLDDKL